MEPMKKHHKNFSVKAEAATAQTFTSNHFIYYACFIRRLCTCTISQSQILRNLQFSNDWSCFLCIEIFDH